MLTLLMDVAASFASSVEAEAHSMTPTFLIGLTHFVLCAMTVTVGTMADDKLHTPEWLDERTGANDEFEKENEAVVNPQGVATDEGITLRPLTDGTPIPLSTSPPLLSVEGLDPFPVLDRAESSRTMSLGASAIACSHSLLWTSIQWLRESASDSRLHCFSQQLVDSQVTDSPRDWEMEFHRQDIGAVAAAHIGRHIFPQL